MWLEIVATVLTIIFVAFKLIVNRRKDYESSCQSMPGLEPSNPIEGNKKEIEKAGSKNEFLSGLHKAYGPIAKFYEGKKLAVSIASPELLKQTRHLNQTPSDLFEQMWFLTGKAVFMFCESDEIKHRRRIYDHHFMMVACRSYSDKFVEIAKLTVDSWIETPGELISLNKIMAKYSLNALLRNCFGDVFKDEKAFTRFQNLVDYGFRNFEPKPKEGTEVYNTLVENCGKIQTMVQKAMDERRRRLKEVKDDDSKLFIDVLLDMDLTEDARKSDVAVFIVGGYFTVSIMLTWCLYEISRNHDIQEKIYKEIVLHLGDQPVTVESMPKLTYIRQVIDEALRVYSSIGFTARISENEMKVGGYDIPAGTAIYTTLGPLFTDQKYWNSPEKFDPDNFTRENSRARNPYSFKPFGFSGKRICPGMNFAYAEMTVFITECIRRCQLHLVPGQDVKMATGFIYFPDREIMLTVEKRQ